MAPLALLYVIVLLTYRGAKFMRSSDKRINKQTTTHLTNNKQTYTYDKHNTITKFVLSSGIARFGRTLIRTTQTGS